MDRWDSALIIANLPRWQWGTRIICQGWNSVLNGWKTSESASHSMQVLDFGRWRLTNETDRRGLHEFLRTFSKLANAIRIENRSGDMPMSDDCHIGVRKMVIRAGVPRWFRSSFEKHEQPHFGLETSVVTASAWKNYKAVEKVLILHGEDWLPWSHYMTGTIGTIGGDNSKYTRAWGTYNLHGMEIFLVPL